MGLGGCPMMQMDEVISEMAAETGVIIDNGDLVLVYEDPTDQTFTEIQTILQETAFYDDVITELNETYIFPQDIAVIFLECGEENAFYDPEFVEIQMCYELIQKYADIFIEEYQGDYDDEVIFASYFTFLHELGHALVDQYQLPITGKEEDAVDSFAAIQLIATGEEAAVIAGIEQFDVDAIEEEEEGLEELPFWGEHSLSIQRLYNITCLVYGSDPEEYADFVTDDFLPAERAENCDAEYVQAADGWERLLANFMQ